MSASPKDCPPIKNKKHPMTYDECYSNLSQRIGINFLISFCALCFLVGIKCCVYDKTSSFMK